MPRNGAFAKKLRQERALQRFTTLSPFSWARKHGLDPIRDSKEAEEGFDDYLERKASERMALQHELGRA